MISLLPPRSSTLILGLLMIMTSCTPPGPKPSWTVQDLYEYGQRYMEKKDYLRALEAFRIITLNYPTSDMVDDALYNLGEAHRLLKEYPVAAVTYRRLIRDFPQSPYAPDAQYNMAVSIFEQSSPVALTQDKTYEAIRELQIFLDEYPDSEVALKAQELLQKCFDKLAEKDYRIGHLYFKLKDWEAARLYFHELVAEFPSSSWATPARFEIAESYAQEKNWQDALMQFEVFLELYPKHELAPKASLRLDEIKSQLAQQSPEAPEGADRTKTAADRMKTTTDRPSKGPGARPSESSTP